MMFRRPSSFGHLETYKYPFVFERLMGRAMRNYPMSCLKLDAGS